MKVRTAAKRDEIVAAAAALFRELGYERASMNELAKRLGGSKGTLYGYFPSKEVLFQEVVRTVATADLVSAANGLQQAVESGTEMRDCLVAFGETMYRVLLRGDDAMAVYRMVVAEAGHSDVGEMFYQAGPIQSVRLLSQLLKGFMKTGQLRNADPDIYAQHLLALLGSETGGRVFQRTPKKVSKRQIRQMCEHAVDTFLMGATPR